MTETLTAQRTPYVKADGLSWWQAIGAGAAGSVAVNLVVFFVARAAGASFALPDGPSIHHVVLGDVVFSSVVPFAIGTGLAALIAVWWRPVLRIAQVIGALLALGTVAGPVSAETDVATQVGLVLMHIVAGVAVVLALEAVRRRARAH